MLKVLTNQSCTLKEVAGRVDMLTATHVTIGETVDHLVSVYRDNIQDNFQFMKVELEELKQKVVESIGGPGEGFAVDGKSLLGALEASAILEKELPDGYVLIGRFVTPHVLLEMVARHLYGDNTCTHQ